jgi:molybdenum cofactor cytidylyltransferase
VQARAVVLAAGESKRMGAQKLLMRYRGRPLIEHAIRAARRWNPIVVAGTQVAEHLRGSGASLVLNTDPERGMAHSLALADKNVPAGAALIVLLGDKPLVSAALIGRVCEELGDADVAYPVHPQTSQPGHPVVFSARARHKIAKLADGDTLHDLRDDAEFASVRVPIDDRGAFFDVDTLDALAGEA